MRLDATMGGKRAMQPGGGDYFALDRWHGTGCNKHIKMKTTSTSLLYLAYKLFRNWLASAAGCRLPADAASLRLAAANWQLLPASDS